MKKRLSILAILLVLTMLLSACDLLGFINPDPTPSQTTTDKPTTTTTSTTAIDPDPDPDPDPECTEHADEDGNGLCDKCGAEIEEDPVPVELPETTMYFVGDSTVASFTDDYFYPRYGYGTQVGNYMTEKVNIENLALSGRSSKSFLTEANYQTLKNSLKAGDFLVIGFGHNDQKSNEEARFTDASKPYTDPTSFGYYLYEYYIKLAQDVGAIPILCTPIVRAKTNDDYSGNEGHITATGDYGAAIREVGEAYGVDVIDLTVLTRTQYETIGFDAACYYHAVIGGQYDSDGVTIVPNWATVDKTHLNIYGAKYVAYLFAREFSELDAWGGYVRDDIAEPTLDDLVPNPNYVISDYTAPDLAGYKPASHFTTITEGWYGTAFGNTGGNPQSSSNGYIAKETAEGVFQVGQHLDSGSNKGKFEGASDGFAFLFRQVDVYKDFTLTVTGKVIYTGSTKQAGFGLMLRDDCVIDQSSSGSISTNYVTAGFYCDSSSMYANFYRENESLVKGKTTVDGLAAVDDTFTMTIERIGQTVNVSVTYNGETYEASHVDFDFLARDTQYMYVGMFANRGTVIEFTNVVFTITGDSQGA